MAWTPYRWDHYEMHLVDSSLATVGHLNEAHMLSYDWGTFGYGKATLALHKDSAAATTLLGEEQFYIKVHRNGTQIRDFMVSKIDHGYERDTFDVDEYVKIFLSPLDMILAQRFCQPETALGTFQSTSLTIDDAFKWIVDHAAGPNAYTSWGAASRVIANLTIAADLSAHGTTQVVDACHKMNLFEFLQKFGPNWGVDWRVRLEITSGNQNQMVFETFTPRRGLDKSESEFAARAPVIINDASVNVPSARKFRETGGMVNVWVASDESGETADASSVSTWGRREALASTSESDKLASLIANKGVREGQEYEFNPSEQMQLGDNFSPGDVVTVGNAHLGIAASDENVKGAFIEITEGGEEDITLTFGNYEKTLGDKMDEGGGGGDGDEYWDPVMGLRDNAALFVPFSADLLQQHVNLVNVDGTVTIVGTVATNTITFSVVPSEVCYWDRNVNEAEVYTATADDDVVPNGGTGTIGQSDDRWPNVYSVLGNFSGDVDVSDLIANGNTVYLGSAKTTYIHLTAQMQMVTAVAAIRFHPGNTYSFAMRTTDFYAGAATGTVECGITSNRWQNVWSVAGNYTGDVTIGTGVGIIHADSVAAGKFLRADGTRFIPGDIAAGDVTGLSDPGTCTVATANAAGTPHTHAITTSNDVSAGGAAILACDANGRTTFDRVQIEAATKYLSAPAGTVLRLTSNGFVTIAPNGTQRIVVADTAITSDTSNTVSCGTAGVRWSNVVSVLGNFSGNVTIAAGKTVDGVDISVHTHNYRKVANYTGGGNEITTSSWHLQGSPDYTSNPLRKQDGTQIYLLDTAFNTGGGAGYTAVGIGAQEHHHNFDYDDTQASAGPN